MRYLVITLLVLRDEYLFLGYTVGNNPMYNVPERFSVGSIVMGEFYANGLPRIIFTMFIGLAMHLPIKLSLDTYLAEAFLTLW